MKKNTTVVNINCKLNKVPFEIEVPYTMKPGMRNLGDSEPITYQDCLSPYYLTEKKRLCSVIYGNNVNKSLYNKALEYLQCSNYREATENYQEDFVVWSANTDGDLSPQIMSVCFPSGWAPEEKINLSFHGIHEPVADNKLIQQAAPHIAKMLTQKGPFVRHVWTVTNSDKLSRHPKTITPWSNESPDQMYYRVERQTTVPLGDAAIFFIRVYVVPLLTMNIDKIKESINTMSDAVLGYKNLNYVKEILNDV